GRISRWKLTGASACTPVVAVSSNKKANSEGAMPFVIENLIRSRERVLTSESAAWRACYQPPILRVSWRCPTKVRLPARTGSEEGGVGGDSGTDHVAQMFVQPIARIRRWLPETA